MCVYKLKYIFGMHLYYNIIMHSIDAKVIKTLQLITETTLTCTYAKIVIVSKQK